MEVGYLRGLHGCLWCARHETGVVREVNGRVGFGGVRRGKRENKTKQRAKKGNKDQVTTWARNVSFHVCEPSCASSVVFELLARSRRSRLSKGGKRRRIFSVNQIPNETRCPARGRACLALSNEVSYKVQTSRTR